MNEDKKTEKPEETKGAALRVTATHDISFSDIDWAINAGEEKELPTDKTVQALILSNTSIRLIK